MAWAQRAPTVISPPSARHAPPQHAMTRAWPWRACSALARVSLVLASLLGPEIALSSARGRGGVTCEVKIHTQRISGAHRPPRASTEAGACERGPRGTVHGTLD